MATQMVRAWCGWTSASGASDAGGLGAACTGQSRERGELGWVGLGRGPEKRKWALAPKILGGNFKSKLEIEFWSIIDLISGTKF